MPVWNGPFDLAGMAYAQTVLGRTDGGAVVGCSNGNATTAIKSIKPNGDSDWGFEHSNPTGRNPEACGSTTAVGADGTVYTTSWTYSNSVVYHLSAYKDGNELWTTQMSSTCTYDSPVSVVLGYDGNVYATIDNQGVCSSTGRRLMGFNPTTGAVLFNVGLGNTQSVRYNGLQPYANGLVVWWGNQFRYFDYSGNEQSSSAQINLANGELILGVAGGTGGKVFATVVKNQSTTNDCHYGQVLSRIVALDASGQLWQYNADPCQAAASQPNSTPANGVVFGEIDNSNAGRIVSVNSSGQAAWTYQPDAGDDGIHVFGNYGSYTGTELVDNNGNVVAWQLYRNEANTRWGYQINILDGATGNRRSVVYTDELELNKSFSTVYVGTSTNRLFVLASACDSMSCPNNNPKLYALNAPGLSLDFPRAAALGLTSQSPAAEKKYAWLGDSFASGEGAPPFDTGTDVGPSEDNFNMCHRSTRSYAHLLDQDPDQSVRLVGPFACSGATTANVINTYQYDNQPPQSSLLTSAVDVVTVSIGGNDVGFAGFAISCVDPQSTCEGASYDTITSNVLNNLPGALDAAYAAIKAKVSTSTKIVVVGYPQLIPDPAVSTTWPYCGYMSSTEKTNARNVVSLINQVTQGAVDRAGSQFVFIDPTASGSPFIGHELCNDGSYFNGVTVQDSVLYSTAYSFHPNADGQRAYWQMIRQHLS
jgi:lysophospholipase L1-like esterase